VIRYGPLIAAPLTALALLAAGCNGFPEQPLQGSMVVPSNTVTDFNVLYGTNCAGCHGADGKGGAARGLADPVFLRIADDAVLRRVTASGVPGTAMPAFARTAGGPLSDEQIDGLVGGMRGRWAGASASDLNPPPYSTSTAGDPSRGGDAFATFCSRCHGADGRGGAGGSSIVDASYLSLVSDQCLRTTVIAGRSDLGAPDWRSNVPGRPMSPDEVSDVVAWLAAKRPQD
jgi:mono/diheme cytochrome c family protein